MREFWVRLVSMLAIVGVLLGYNTLLDVRAKEDEIARLELALLYLHIVNVAVIRLICRASPEVSAEVGIDLIDRPADETGAVELVVALSSEHIRRSEL